jgi:hypothetical protein
MKLQIDFDQVIRNHSHWKYLLKKAIEQGQSELTEINARDPHHCAFGKWLFSPAGKVLPHYLEVVELHQHFHKEAAKVLDLALQGQPNEASESLKLGSPFNQATAKLINKLGEIRDTLEPVRKVVK